jgi:hypothetical protein
MATKNLCGKTRDVNNPYEVWRNEDAGWEWRVLKKWQCPEKEAENQYARWFCAVKSPFTFGSYEMGDTYVREVKANAVQVEFDADTLERW